MKTTFAGNELLVSALQGRGLYVLDREERELLPVYSSNERYRQVLPIAKLVRKAEPGISGLPAQASLAQRRIWGVRLTDDARIRWRSFNDHISPKAAHRP